MFFQLMQSLTDIHQLHLPLSTADSTASGHTTATLHPGKCEKSRSLLEL